jgi:hypothetical protein
MWARYLIVIGLIALLPMSLSCAGTLSWTEIGVDLLRPQKPIRY